MYAHLGKLIVTLVFVLHGAAPAVTHVIADNSRIVGGLPATDVDTGYVVSLIIRDSLGNAKHCGGSIINEQTILTAAHCIHGHSASAVKVEAGTKQFLSGHVRLLPVKAVHLHPNYNDITVDYDIGLVRLAAPLQFSNSIRAVRLADSVDVLLDGSWATVYGWGRTENSKMSRVLMYTKVQIVNQKTCSWIMRVTDRMMCAGYPYGGVGSCSGDSGGPLVQNGKLIGIVSWGMPECGLSQYPDIYARVATLRSWVDKTLAKHYNEQL